MKDLIGCILIIVGAIIVITMITINAFIYSSFLGTLVAGGILIVSGIVIWDA